MIVSDSSDSRKRLSLIRYAEGKSNSLCVLLPQYCIMAALSDGPEKNLMDLRTNKCPSHSTEQQTCSLAYCLDIKTNKSPQGWTHIMIMLQNAEKLHDVWNYTNHKQGADYDFKLQ